MAATNYTPIQLYFSTTASAAPTAANLAQGELAINITDGKLYYEDGSGVVQVIASKNSGTVGGATTQIQYNNANALAGSAAMVFNNSTNVTTLTTLNLTNALGAIYGGTAQSTYAQGDFLYASAANTLAKLGIGANTYILTSTGTVPQWVAPSSIAVLTATNLAGGLAGSVPYQSALDTTTFLAIGAANRVMTSTGTAPQWVTSLTGLTGVSSSSITDTGLTSGRVTFASTSGLLADSANLTFNGTTLTTAGLSNSGFSTLVKTLTLGDTSFNGTAVFAAATPAKLYMGTGTVTDVTSAISATNTTGAIASLAITPIAATNTGVTYTNASTLYIAGAPSAGTNITITNPYSLYVAGGAVYLGGNTAVTGTLSATGGISNTASSGNSSIDLNTTVTDWRILSRTSDGTLTIQDLTNSKLPFSIEANSADSTLRVLTTGLAVTGTLSATGTISQTTATTGNQLSFTGNNGNDLFLVSNSTTTTRRYSIQTGSGNTQLWLGVNGDAIKIRETGVDVVLPLAVTGTLSATGTLSGGTSGTGYSFSGSAPATSLTLDSSGNLLVGGTSGSALSGSATIICVKDTVTTNVASVKVLGGTSQTQIELFGTPSTTGLWTSSNTPMLFATNNTERARITSGGYFKASNAGTYNSSSGTYHELRQTTDETIAIFTNTSATLTGTVRGVRIGFTAASPNDTANYLLYCDDSTSLRAGFRSNGGLANFSANDSNLSDQRVKTDIQDAGGYLAKICAIPVRTFKYKDQTDELLNLGVIAQEVEAIAPELVDTTGFGETPQDGIPLKAIYQTDLQYALMKCIQEQQALITQLTARITALETA